MLKVLALLTFLASAAVHAQTPLHTDLPLKYLEQAPTESRNQPLVIFLHGSQWQRCGRAYLCVVCDRRAADSLKAR